MCTASHRVVVFVRSVSCCLVDVFHLHEVCPLYMVHKALPTTRPLYLKCNQSATEHQHLASLFV
jgi:hypothetical protein